MTASPVMKALALARIEQEPTAFGKWCIQRNVRSLPAAPIHVAAFIRDCNLPVEKVWEAVQEVSQLHLTNGLADPTAGGVVAETMNVIAQIAPPRSWPAELKARFLTALPYDVQRYLVEREHERDNAVRRAQNDAALARKALSALKQSMETNDGTTQQDA